MIIPGATTRMPKHSIQHGNWRTSISLEPEFWQGFKRIAGEGNISRLAFEINSKLSDNDNQGLSSAIRVFVLRHAIDQAREWERRAKLNRLHVRKSRTYTGELRSAIRALTGADNQIAEIEDGLAPMSVVIAGGRANA